MSRSARTDFRWLTSGRVTPSSRARERWATSSPTAGSPGPAAPAEAGESATDGLSGQRRRAAPARGPGSVEVGSWSPGAERAPRRRAARCCDPQPWRWHRPASAGRPPSGAGSRPRRTTGRSAQGRASRVPARRRAKPKGRANGPTCTVVGRLRQLEPTDDEDRCSQTSPATVARAKELRMPTDHHMGGGLADACRRRLRRGRRRVRPPTAAPRARRLGPGLWQIASCRLRKSAAKRAFDRSLSGWRGLRDGRPRDAASHLPRAERLLLHGVEAQAFQRVGSQGGNPAGEEGQPVAATAWR